MNKSDRQRKILQLIKHTTIYNQSELLKLLKHYGFSATQASVSRDLNELGIEKIDGSYRMGRNSTLGREFDALSLLTAGDNLIVARCRPGLASALAVEIDERQYADIVGTIAGDDTVFIAVANKKDQSNIVKALKEEYNV
jgi:transcriptional regulator of arginine metabolism